MPSCYLGAALFSSFFFSSRFVFPCTRRQRVTVQPFLGAPPAWQTDDDSSSSSSRSIISDSGSANHHGHRHHNGAPPVVELEYDTLVYACGVQASGFGVKGVLEHCYFLKEVHGVVIRCLYNFVANARWDLLSLPPLLAIHCDFQKSA